VRRRGKQTRKVTLRAAFASWGLGVMPFPSRSSARPSRFLPSEQRDPEQDEDHHKGDIASRRYSSSADYEAENVDEGAHMSPLGGMKQ
jgi:hypothetical protein